MGSTQSTDAGSVLFTTADVAQSTAVDSATRIGQLVDSLKTLGFTRAEALRL